MKMRNMPEIKMGIVGVSRDCFPVELTRSRLAQVEKECVALGLPVEVCGTIVESESDAIAAVAELTHAEVDAVTVYLGNFGPEGPTTIFMREMNAPCMVCGAAEESRKTLRDARGDALCGMLNACFNAGLRNLRPFVPPEPIGLPHGVAANIRHFIDVARVVTGIRHLKVISFGPRPQDFYACNAPIKPLYNLGMEIMENSELDLLDLYRSAADRKNDIAAVAADMEKELGAGNRHPEKLEQLAQFEVALMTFLEENLGASRFGVFANKCWPAFEKAFGFVPCYVNSRLASKGIPAACEVDIYGAVSEYIAQLASKEPATILDINNSVPEDMDIADLKGVARRDLFMGFHCGNTPACQLCKGCGMKHQVIMSRIMEPGRDPDITCGTLEGTLRPGPLSIMRLQSTPDGAGLMSYLSEGSVLDVDPATFGGVGVIAVKDFSRFYRYVLLERQFPHHAAVAFSHVGAVVFDALGMMGIHDVHTPHSEGHLYPGESPFRWRTRNSKGRAES